MSIKGQDGLHCSAYRKAFADRLCCGHLFRLLATEILQRGKRFLKRGAQPSAKSRQALHLHLPLCPPAKHPKHPSRTSANGHPAHTSAPLHCRASAARRQQTTPHLDTAEFGRGGKDERRKKSQMARCGSEPRVLSFGGNERTARLFSFVRMVCKSIGCEQFST